MQKLNSKRFGVIEYPAEDVIFIEGGMIGFSESQNFLLLSAKDDSPFRWLQSIEIPELAFLVAVPGYYLQDYSPEISANAAQALNVSKPEEVTVFVTAAIPPGRPKDLTLNLAAPVVVNTAERRGLQVVLDNPAYTMRYRVFQETDDVELEPAA